MKKKWLAAVAVIGMSALGVTGCNKESETAVEEVEVLTEEELAAMEEEQNKIIAEYAAGVLMKYNAGTNSRVLEGQKLAAAEAKEAAVRAKEERRKQLYAEYYEEETNEAEEAESSSGSNNGGSGTKQAAETVNYIGDLSGAVDAPAFSITYSGYEVTDSYGGSDMFFTIDAAAGKSLLIGKFSAQNTGGQQEELNMLSKDIEFRLKFADRSVKAQRTMLLDDLTMFRGVLEAGEAKELVTVFEIPSEMISELGNMELVVENSGQRSNMILEGGSAVVPPQNDEISATNDPEVIIVDIEEEESSVPEVQEEMMPETGTVEDVLEEESDASIITTVGSNNSITIETGN